MAFTDVYDSAISSLALAQRLAEHRARMHHTHGASSAGLGSGDQWYVDRQAFVRLDITDEWLRSVDAVFAVGGSRSAGECKSHARLLCTPAYAASIGPSSSPKVLGVHIGGDACSADLDKLTLWHRRVLPSKAYRTPRSSSH